LISCPRIGETTQELSGSERETALNPKLLFSAEHEPTNGLLGKWLVECYAGGEGGATRYFPYLARPALWA